MRLNRPDGRGDRPNGKSRLKHAIRSSPRLTAAARQLVGLVPASWRLGRDFWQWYTFFNESEHWPEDRLVDYQMQRLRGLLAELARTSDFYRERLAGIKIESLCTPGEFRAQVPALTRNEFREHYPALRSRDWRSVPAAKSQTSGTTGLALQFYHSARDKGREWAAICHQWKRVGFDPARSRRAEFRGLTEDGKWVEVFPEQNMIRCSILHLQEQHVRYYAEQIRRHGMNFYHGYPSALYLLAQVICRHQLDFPQPKAVLLASEEVCDWQVAQLEAAFPQAKIFAHYGCAERTVLGGWCESRREYHVLPQYALVEVDPVNSEIIGTNLFNTLNGFVRYRMSDTALKVESVPCPACGRAYLPRLAQLGGRIEQYLYSPQRGWIPPAIVTYCLKSLKAIREVQFVQQKRNELIIRYTVDTQAREPELQVERDSIVQGLRHMMGADMEIHFEQVESFPRSATGKFQWIICQLKDACDPMEQAVLWKP